MNKYPLLALYGCLVSIVALVTIPIAVTSYQETALKVEQEKNRGQYERMTYDKVIEADHRSEAKRSFNECMKNADTETSQDFCLRVYEIEIE